MISSQAGFFGLRKLEKNLGTEAFVSECNSWSWTPHTKFIALSQKKYPNLTRLASSVRTRGRHFTDAK